HAAVASRVRCPGGISRVDRGLAKGPGGPQPGAEDHRRQGTLVVRSPLPAQAAQADDPGRAGPCFRDRRKPGGYSAAEAAGEIPATAGEAGPAVNQGCNFFSASEFSNPLLASTPRRCQLSSVP